jgi:hypothetical protein
MQREGYWDYMGRKLREEWIKKEVISQEDMWKKEIADMKKTLQWCYIRIRELNDEIYELKSQPNIIIDDDRQTKMEF